MRNILLTGGAGFIGINFLIFWIKKYDKDKIIIFDKITYSANFKKIKKIIKMYSNVHFIKGDIIDNNLIKKTLKKYKINCIINFAAETHVDNSIKYPNKFINTNILGTYNLLENARIYWNKSVFKKTHFHQISTDEVYGSLNKFQKSFTENSPFNPSSPYSASKASADLIVKSYYKTFNMNVTISNTSNNYGPYINIEKLIPKVVVKILYDKKIPIYGNGNQIREWIFVNDHIIGIEKILLKGKYGQSYNLGSKFRINNINLVKKICKIMDGLFIKDKKLKIIYPKANHCHISNSKKLISFVPDRMGHDFKYALNINKAKNKLLFKNSNNFDDSLTKTIAWFLYNKNEWNE